MANTIFHSLGLIIVLFLEDWWLPFQFRHNIWWTAGITKPVFLTILAAFLYLSVISAIFHWKLSLKDLFQSPEKHPQYRCLQTRIESFREAEKFNKNIEWRYFLNLAKSGFFCLSLDGQVLCCFDCGIELTGWKGKNRNVELDAINLIHAACLMKFKIQYLPDIFKQDIKLGKDNSNSALHDVVTPEIYRQRFSKFYRVKPTCNALKENAFDFKKLDVRLRSFDVMDSDLMFHRFPFGIEEVAMAGFVKTSRMTTACYSCFLSIDWSSSDARTSPSPWAMHAWKNKDLDLCSHLRYHLKEKKNRLKTFPKAAEDYSPMELSEAGFYCIERNIGGYFWVKCHRKDCDAHSYFKRTKDKYNAFRKVSTFDYLDFDTTDGVRGKKLIEVPGDGQNEGNIHVNRENPILEHFIQNPFCPFITQCLESKDNRVGTFPTNWQVRNKLNISAEEVGAAGYMYFPESLLSDECDKGLFTSRIFKSKRIRQFGLSQLSASTMCPKCHHIVDWSLISQKYDMRNIELTRITEICHC